MKKLSILLIFGVSIALLLQTSCSIEKRHYRSGFYVDYGAHKNAKGTMVEKQASPVLAINNTVAEAQSEPSTEDQAQPIFHQTAEEHLVSTTPTAFAHKANLSKTETNVEAKQINKSEAIKALKQNAKALAFYAQSHKNKGGGGEQIVALLLCFFLGALGIHSFYLGNKKKGIWQLVMFLVGILTFWLIIGYVILAALSIWVLIDFIRLIIGDLGPGW